MSTSHVLAAAQRIAVEVGVPYEDLTDELPARQVAAIRDRVARRRLVMREAAVGAEHREGGRTGSQTTSAGRPR